VATQASNVSFEHALYADGTRTPHSARWDSSPPFTERFLGEAGTRLDQRVPDLGSGVGDVSMLLAKLVGPSGEVVGIERDANSIARSWARVKTAGLNNVSFTLKLHYIERRTRRSQERNSVHILRGLC